MLYRTIIYLIVILFLVLTYPIFIVLALLARNKGNGYIIGINEFCNNINTIKHALNITGFNNAHTLVTDVESFFANNNYDYVVPRSNLLRKNKLLKEASSLILLTGYFIKFLFTKKNFILHTHKSFMPLNLDYPLLKLANKNIVIFHIGDDVRYRPIHNKLFKINNIDWILPLKKDPFNLEFIHKLLLQKIPSMLNIPVYTVMNQETFINRPCYLYRFPQIDNCAPNNKIKNKIPHIIHAPSNRTIKGTDIVLEAINKLKAEGYKFDFTLVENKSNKELIEILKQTDIVIDQPAPWVGRFAVEGMAHSCVIIGGNDSKYESSNFQLPVIQFKRNTQDLYNKIRQLITNDHLEELKQQHYECYKKYYSPKAFSKHLNLALKNRIEKDLIPPTDHKQKLMNNTCNLFQLLILYFLLKNQAS